MKMKTSAGDFSERLMGRRENRLKGCLTVQNMGQTLLVMSDQCLLFSVWWWGKKVRVL